MTRRNSIDQSIDQSEASSITSTRINDGHHKLSKNQILIHVHWGKTHDVCCACVGLYSVYNYTLTNAGRSAGY